MRTFFCIELEDDLKEKLDKVAQVLKQGTAAKVNWVKRENLHVTLKFLGEVNPESLEELRQAAEAASDSISPFKLILDRVGAFPSPARPRVIWIGSRVEPEEAHRLYDRLEENLNSLGFEPEGKRYIPHVTLGRVKERDRGRLKELATAIGNIDQFEFTAEASGITLMESKLTPRGPIYEPLFKITF